MRSIVVAAVLGVLVVSCGSDSDAGEPEGEPRVVEVTATEYTFHGDPGALLAGDVIEFVVSNVGQLDHSMDVLSPSGRSLGATDRLGPGETGEVTVAFEEAGAYRLICDVDDHLSRGQVVGLDVGER